MYIVQHNSSQTEYENKIPKSDMSSKPMWLKIANTAEKSILKI